MAVKRINEQPNYYTILSAEVRYDKNLTANAKLLYAEITALLDMNGECFASNRYFSELYGKSTVTISKWIRELALSSYISTTYTYKGQTKEIDRRYIRILKGGIKENLKTPLKKTYEGIKENFKDSSISNNNNTTYSNIKGGRFKKPTVNEIADYCLERKNNLDAETFFDFYESKDWRVGRNKMKDWMACVRTWEKRRLSNKQSSVNKLHKHISSHLEAKELLKKQRQ